MITRNAAIDPRRHDLNPGFETLPTRWSARRTWAFVIVCNAAFWAGLALALGAVR